MQARIRHKIAVRHRRSPSFFERTPTQPRHTRRTNSIRAHRSASIFVRLDRTRPWQKSEHREDAPSFSHLWIRFPQWRRDQDQRQGSNRTIHSCRAAGGKRASTASLFHLLEHLVVHKSAPRATQRHPRTNPETARNRIPSPQRVSQDRPRFALNLPSRLATPYLSIPAG